MGDCDWGCGNYIDLNVNSKSQALLLCQDGNGSSHTSLNVFSEDGKIDTIVSATREWEGFMCDMDLDSCDNVYLTGSNSAIGITNFQYSPEFKVTWQKVDSSYSFGVVILSLAYNDCFIYEIRGDNTAGNYKHLQAPIVTRCKSLLSINDQIPLRKVRVFPNPFEKYLKIEDELGETV
jgi:hypothetical protein